jgi:hypothetical protein
MPPASRRLIWSSAPVRVAAKVDVIDGQWLRWTSGKPAEWADSAAGALDAFTALASAEPEGMAAFIETYGIPELCGEHGLPDAHRLDVGGYCPMRVGQSGEYVELWIWTLHRMARGFAAARCLGIELNARRLGDMSDWVDLQFLTKDAFVPDDGMGYQRRRKVLAEVLTRLLRSCRVRPLALWDGHPLVTVFEADGLMGALAIQLGREIVAGDSATDGMAYACVVCGQPDERRRRPHEGEAIYCKRVECKREQQRRNKAAWLERRRAEGNRSDGD